MVIIFSFQGSVERQDWDSLRRSLENLSVLESLTFVDICSSRDFHGPVEASIREKLGTLAQRVTVGFSDWWPENFSHNGEILAPSATQH